MAQNKTSEKIDMKYPERIKVPYILSQNAPQGEDNSDQYPESLPLYFIENFSTKGAHVFDPFMGFGTTAFACEKLGRIPYGIEADGERFEWSAGQLEHWKNIANGDAAEANEYGFPPMDLCITSPPFMPKNEDWNPLYGGDPEFSGYDLYLARMGFIFEQIAQVMKPDGLVVVHVDDVQGEVFTPLIADIKQMLSQSMNFEAKIRIDWNKNAPRHYPKTQCLVFKKLP